MTAVQGHRRRRRDGEHDRDAGRDEHEKCVAQPVWQPLRAGGHALLSDAAAQSGELFSRADPPRSDERVMHTTRTRIGWALAIAAASVGIVAWPLATGAGLTLAVGAVFAGLRAAAAAILVIVVVLAAVGLRVDADERRDDRPARAERGR